MVYVFYFLLHLAPEPLGRLNDVYYDTPKTITGFYLIDSLIAGDWATFGGALAQIILPAISLGLFALAPIARITRAAMLASLGSDFVRTARACGLSPPQDPHHLCVQKCSSARRSTCSAWCSPSSSDRMC